MLRTTKESVMVVVLLVVGITSGIDLYTDTSHGASLSHILKEGLIIVLALILVVWILYEQRQQLIQIQTLKTELERSELQKKKAHNYVLTARKQLSEVIGQQFDEWGLSSSEKEVGWLLLKGFSLKEIAIVRDTHEKTVRQQASAIYKKSGLNGRHSFSAWFVEDLL